MKELMITHAHMSRRIWISDPDKASVAYRSIKEAMANYREYGNDKEATVEVDYGHCTETIRVGAVASVSLTDLEAGEEAAGDVILSVDEAAGTIVAASRVTYPGGITGDSSTRSTLTFLAKDGRFKIQHTNIETASANTGSLANPGYTRQGKWKFSQWEKADAALQALSSKLAECVKSAASASSW